MKDQIASVVLASQSQFTERILLQEQRRLIAIEPIGDGKYKPRWQWFARER